MSNGFQTKREMAADKLKGTDMTQDEIIDMAKQAGLTSVDKKSHYLRDCLERFAKLVAEKEREACAKVAENRALVGASDIEKIAHNTACKNIAKDIRARGEQT
jgi:hypothetical protein